MPTTTESVLLGLYLLAGPLAWALIAYAAFKGMQRMGQLRPGRRRALSPPLPNVSILIPAKDEQYRIADCLRSALAQDYPQFEVIAVDDRSADGTGQVMDDLAAADARLKVIHLTQADLLEGWTGKCNALRHAANRATGQWLLLVDSDVILAPNALSVTLAAAVERNYGLISLFPRLECHSFWEQLTIPLAGAALMLLHLVALTNTEPSHVAFANGQFILIRRDAYDAIGGHWPVRGQFCEDIEIARLLKRNRSRPRICWGPDLAAVRMYSSMKSIRRGWARIFYAAGRGRPWHTLTGILMIFLCGLSAYVAVAWGIYRLWHPAAWIGLIWLIGGAIHLLIMTAALAAAYRSTGNPPRRALEFPLAAAALIAIFAQALRLCFIGRLEWRGTQYNPGRRYTPVQQEKC